MGEAARNYIIALTKADVDISTEKIPHPTESADFGEGHRLATQLENRDNKYQVKIVHATGDLFLKHLEPLKYHIAHLFWEVDRMDKAWVWNTNLADEVWTGSEYSKEALKKSGVKIPIFVFPQAVKTIYDDPIEPLDFPNHKGYLFYSIFQWIERKNPKALVQSYLKEFENNDDVSLLLKVFGLNYSQDEALKIKKDIAEWKTELNQKHYPRIFIDTALRDKSDIYRIHSAGDCFVLPHRGEGWGIPIVEAMTFAKPVITTNLGGCTEWFHKDYVHLLKYDMVNVFNMDYVPWYTEDQKWAEVDQADLREKMRHLYEHRDIGQAMGRKGQEVVNKQFNYETVGNLLKKRLEDIGRIIE